jgi:Tfp pilus assembly protein PilN
MTCALNLASRPSRNELLPSLLFYLAVAAALGVTVKHGLVLRRLLPDKTSALHARVTSLQTEAARLRSEGAALRGPAPEPAVVARWSELKDLVDRRTFSWTRLLARLERVVPQGVRVTAILPSVRGGRIELEITAQAQSTDAGFELLKRLQARPEFEDPMPVAVTESGREGEGAKEFRLKMRYRPDAAPAEEPAAPPEGGDESAAGDEEEPS